MIFRSRKKREEKTQEREVKSFYASCAPLNEISSWPLSDALDHWINALKKLLSHGIPWKVSPGRELRVWRISRDLLLTQFNGIYLWTEPEHEWGGKILHNQCHQSPASLLSLFARIVWTPLSVTATVMRDLFSSDRAKYVDFLSFSTCLKSTVQLKKYGDWVNLLIISRLCIMVQEAKLLFR